MSEYDAEEDRLQQFYDERGDKRAKDGNALHAADKLSRACGRLLAKATITTEDLNELLKAQTHYLNERN